MSCRLYGSIYWKTAPKWHRFAQVYRLFLVPQKRETWLFFDWCPLNPHLRETLMSLKICNIFCKIQTINLPNYPRCPLKHGSIEKYYVPSINFRGKTPEYPHPADDSVCKPWSDWVDGFVVCICPNDTLTDVHYIIETVPRQNSSQTRFLETVPRHFWKQFHDTFENSSLTLLFKSNDLWLIIIIL